MIRPCVDNVDERSCSPYTVMKLDDEILDI